MEFFFSQTIRDVWLVFINIYTHAHYFLLSSKHTKIYPCNKYFNPIEKMRIAVVYNIYLQGFFPLFLIQNIDCVYPLEPLRRGGSNVYQQSMF